MADEKHLDAAEQWYLLADRQATRDEHDKATRAITLAVRELIAHLRSSASPPDEKGSEDSTPMDRSGSAFWIVELESTDENDPGWFANTGGAGDDRITGYYLREDAERAGAESVGLGYRWRVKWVAPANRKSSPGDDNSRKPESAAAVRDRLGWPPLSEEQKAANLAHNLGEPPDEKGEGPSEGFAAWFAEHGDFVVRSLRKEAEDTERRHTGYDHSGYIAALRKAASELDDLDPSHRPGSDGGGRK